MEKPKQITIIAWRDQWHPDAGGAEKYITRIAEDLARDHEVTFLCTNYTDAKEKPSAINGVRYIRIGQRYTAHTLLPLYFFFRLRGETDYLIENFNAWPFLAPWMLPKRNVTIVHHMQDWEWVAELGLFLGTFFRLCASLVLHVMYRKAKIVTVSPSTRDQLVESHLGKQPIPIVYNGIDDHFFTEGDPLKHKEYDVIKLISLGRVVKQKRVQITLKLLSGLDARWRKKVHLDIVGRGVHERNLQKQVKKLHLEDIVTFHGYVSDQEKLKLLQQAHLHLQLAAKEGWGVTVTEAASQGVPSLAFRVLGLRDSITPQTGYLVDDRNELWRTFRRLLKLIEQQAPEYKDKQKAAIAWAKKFTWKSQLAAFRIVTGL